METAPTDLRFPVRFAGRLRPSQRDAAGIARRQLAEGRRRIHIVAPPGSGKTVLGLYLWAECVQRAAVVLSPNSAIQAQWAARTSLLEIDPAAADSISTDPNRPGLLTSLTYQSVTLPRRGGDDLDAQARELWQDRLVEEQQAEDPEEARVWIDDLKRHNRAYFERRLAAYRKAVRDRIALGGEALSTLHRSSLETLKRLQERGVGLVILDECHHLMSHWGRVLADARELLRQPVVIGLTATPPDRKGRPPQDVQRYDEFFGPVDYEVPVPAVVKDGFLAPYQDLVYFVRPTTGELKYLATTDREFHKLVKELCQLDEPEPGQHVCEESLTDWVGRVLAERRLPTGVVEDWASFERRDPAFARSARLFLMTCGRPMPRGVPEMDVLVSDASPDAVPEMDVLVPVLDRYVRHRLRRSADPADHELGERAIAKLRVLGVQITETGPRACASPAGRVMAYSRAKTEALLPVLKAECRALGERIRAVVIADYEKTSAVTSEIRHLLDEEAGGAIAAFRALLSDPVTDGLNPVLVTGSTVLVDDDLAPRFLKEARRWLQEHLGCGVYADRPHGNASDDVQSTPCGSGEAKGTPRLSYTEEDGFHVLTGEGDTWCPRVYVGMITELLQRGVTKCLVGTRGLLGEGWDAQKVNVLVNLAAVTTSTSVNQLRGRSIRLDPDEPEKLADNWDIVCIAPEFAKGLDDYQRFIDRHKTIYGLTDDGAIQKGVGHVHAALTELKPEGVEGSVGVLNAEMLQRAGRRAEFRALWRIGQPYRPEPIRALEVRGVGEGGGGGFPPFARSKAPWSGTSLAAAVGHAVLAALEEAGLLKRDYQLHVGQRAGGYVRMFLENADEQDGALFARSLHEALGPLHRPRYVISRYADEISETWLSRILPRIVARYFRRRQRRMATLHAVPSALAKNKRLATVYARHWNLHVSPGEAIYTYQGEGQQLVERARRDGTVPRSTIHDKEVFL